ncbi:hypothetical protein M2323_002748 [Rhodoblastus acidophilus]|uniref:AAA family ATPase n=1 Tax=Rhodoblastus acidophilus TaxID=1074 RepID=UPI002225A741|nr:AAA family ATPase [Rhodoblastus acidophilus]MCW2284898.1 hypothetical protein [Rhodoblastus acidophilus]MCW2333812.1 hypothetical protein [Rhodoblastus acidophilus]
MAETSGETKARQSHNRKLALRLVSAGLAIFPAVNKNPIAKRFQHLDTAMTASEIAEAAAEFRDNYGREPAYVGSTKNPAIVRKLWSEYPDAVPAICGGPNGLLILDVDFGNGKDGPRKLAAWLNDQGQELPKGSPVTATQSGGLHVFFRDPDGMGNHEGVFADLDTNVRGRGGYVIAPGAWREDGKRYSAAPKAPDLASAFASGSIPALPAFIREAIQTRTRPIEVSDADAARLTLDNMPEWDAVRAKFDLDGLADRNAKMRAILRFDDALDDAPDFSANRIKLATRLAGDHGDAFTFEDWAAIAENCEGTGHYVEKLSSEKVPGEFDLRALRREFMKAKAATKQPDGLAFGVVELSAEEMGERPHVANDNAKEPEKAEKPKIKSFSQFRAEYVPQSFVAEPAIVAAYLYTLTARTGHGKTLFLSSLAIAVATGRRDILGMEVRQGKVLYFSFENPEDFRVKLCAAAVAHNADVAALDANLHIVSVKTAPELMRKLAKAAAKPWRLVIVDTLQAGFDGKDANDNMEALAYLRRLRPLCATEGRPAVVVAAHPVKNASKDNLLPYGAGSVANEADGNLTLWKDDSARITTLHWQGKLRGFDFDPMAFAIAPVTISDMLDDKGRPLVMPAAKPVSSDDAATALEKAEAQTTSRRERILRAALSDPSGSIQKWSEATGINKGSIHRDLERMAQEKLVEKIGSRWTVTARGKRIAVASEATEPSAGFTAVDDD